MVTLDLEHLYSGTAKLADLPQYERAALEQAGKGNAVKLTGRAPVWLYLRVAHVLHGKVTTLLYDSPVTREVVIFDHNPH